MTPYDPDARRDTPLALELKERIERTGPITVSDYMKACLEHREHGYYRRQQAIGKTGDFITAPEISQIFGELIGLWAAVVWQQMGSPARFNLIELGPGRGTLMSDALRATARVPGFTEAVTVIFVDIAPHEQAADAVPSASIEVRRLERVRDLPAHAPSIVIANEFLDTCPVQQFVVRDKSFLMRGVGLTGGALNFVHLPNPDRSDAEAFIQANPDLVDGAILEAQDWRVLHELCRQQREPWAGLFIDYGHYDPNRLAETGVGADTLQAVHNHAYEHPLTSPGEADLTCQVDFNDVKLQFETCSASGDHPNVLVEGPITQAEFLGRLGIMQRASVLMAANPDKATTIETGVGRLMSPQGMGGRFKVIGVRSEDLPTLPGFE